MLASIELSLSCRPAVDPESKRARRLVQLQADLRPRTLAQSATGDRPLFAVPDRKSAVALDLQLHVLLGGGGQAPDVSPVEKGGHPKRRAGLSQHVEADDCL